MTYVKLEDVLALIPDNDVCGPKPSHLREQLNTLLKTKIEKYFIVPESDLRRLIDQSNHYEGLDWGGVDNWDWYGESLHSYLENQQVKDFDELTELDLARFTEVK